MNQSREKEICSMACFDKRTIYENYSEAIQN